MKTPSDLRQHPNTHGKPYPEPLTGKLRVQTTSLAVWLPAFDAQKSFSHSYLSEVSEHRVPRGLPNRQLLGSN